MKNIFGECEIVRNEQEIENAVTYSNGSGDSVGKVNGAANIPPEVTKSTGVCPLTVGKQTNAHLVGESTVQAEGGTIAWDKE